MDLIVPGTTTPIPFTLVLASDHLTGATGKTVTVMLSKNCAAFAPASGVVTEIASGNYEYTPTAAETGTHGALIVHATAPACDPFDAVFPVGEEYVALNSTKPIPFLLIASVDHVSGLPGVTPTVTTSKAGAAFGAPAGTIAELAYGWWTLTPTSVDTGSIGAFILRAIAIGADPVDDDYQISDPAAGAGILTPWSTADLIRRCKLHFRRPTVDAAISDTDWASYLTEAQAEAYPDLFSRFPDLQYGDPILLTTADGGLTYRFGTDAQGDYRRPMGQAVLYPNLAAIPDDPLEEGEDFIAEGGLVRMLGHRARSFANGPYARMVIEPDVPLTTTYDPPLYPKPARMLLVWKALQHVAARPGSSVDPSYYLAQYTALLDKLFLQYATAYNRSGSAYGRKWYSRTDLGPGFLNT